MRKKTLEEKYKIIEELEKERKEREEIFGAIVYMTYKNIFGFHDSFNIILKDIQEVVFKQKGVKIKKSIVKNMLENFENMYKITLRGRR